MAGFPKMIVEMRKEIKIGIFAIIVLFCLYWGINFLKGRDLFGRTDTFYAYYDDVSGIQVSTPVLVRGINVGSVSRIKFMPEMGNKVQLEFNVKNRYNIPDNSVLRMTSTGIIGGKALELDLGNSPTPFRDGAVIPSMGQISLLEQKADELITQIGTTLTNVNRLLADNAVSIAGTLENLDKATGSLSALLGDDQGSLHSVMRNIDRFSVALAASSDRVEGIVSDVAGIASDLNAADLGAVVGSLNAAVAELNTTLVKVNEGEGSLGMLVSDAALYESLAAAAENLNVLLADIKQNPGRYVRISVFGGRNK